MNLSLTRSQISGATAFKEVVFREHANATIGRKFTSLFPGLGYAAGYKVCHFTRGTDKGIRN